RRRGRPGNLARTAKVPSRATGDAAHEEQPSVRALSAERTTDCPGPRQLHPGRGAMARSVDSTRAAGTCAPSVEARRPDATGGPARPGVSSAAGPATTGAPARPDAPRPSGRPGSPGPRPMSAPAEGFRRAHPSALPASGAWRPGDPVGRRQFMSFPAERPFALEGGGLLRGVTLAYETWGELAPDGGNAILVCHALTGDSHAAGGLGDGHASPGWWDDLIGSGRAFDTDRWFVVCVDVLAGGQGTTGPASPRPDDGRPWASRFPVVTIRDMVRTQAAVADHLGVERWALVAGGSMGGMQVLEWGVMYPERVRALLPIATAAAASAQQIGWWSSGR